MQAVQHNIHRQGYWTRRTDAEAANMFAASKRLIQDHIREYKNGAAVLKDLMQKVLRHPDFDPKDVDHDMRHPFDLDGHRFRGKNPQVQISIYNMLFTIVYSMIYNTQYADRKSVV